MPTMPKDYYDRFDPAKNYEKVLYRDGYVLQGAEVNEVQSAANHRLQGVADALFKDGDIIRDAQIIVDKASGRVKASSGAVYLKGAVRGVPAAEFVIPVAGSVAVGLRLKETVISELEDPSLYNPAIGSRGEGEPGAWRLKVEAAWSFDADASAQGEFYPVYVVDDGELRAKEAPPNLDSFTQGIARYDRDSTAGGSYVVSGLTVLKAADDAEGNQVYTVAEGRARVNGYGVDLPTSRRLAYAAAPDLRLIDTEVAIADATGTQPGGQRVNVAHAPLWSAPTAASNSGEASSTGAASSLEGSLTLAPAGGPRNIIVRITTRRTVTLSHGSYSGCQDALPDTAVVGIVECRQGETIYSQGADYKKTGDKVDWSPTGAEPATGSTYSVTYECIVSAEPKNVDADGFSVEGAVAGSSILYTYQQALPRIDRLALTQEGQFQWLQGVASELAARAPAVPAGLLPIATVYQTWRDNIAEGANAPQREVQSDGVRVVPFDEISAINRRIDYVLGEVARQRLEADISTREAGARAGVFVDPLLNDEMRDQGLAQTAAVINGNLTLPITAKVSGLSADVARPQSLACAAAPALAQLLRTGEMRVNPYQAFEPLPARASLTPAVDQWTETDTQWASAVTQRFDVTRDGAFHVVVGQSTASRTEQVSSSTSNLEYLRQIDVAYRIDGFGAGERLAAATFDGVDLSISGTADGGGMLSGSFRIPPNIPAGAKTVHFSGAGGSRATAQFVGQGQLTVTTLRQVNSITTVWIDPLAQTFVLERDMQLAGVDLWFTAAGSSPRVQIREVQNGVPGRAILAEANIAKNSVATDGGHTRALFDSPLSLAANTEYALVALCDDAETALAVAELGKFDAHVQKWVTSQPYQVGVLLSSSNGSTWTAHQEKDLAFRLLEAVYSESARIQDLGQAQVASATDLLLLSLAETPSAAARVEYELTLPDGSALTVASGQPLRLPAAVSGQVKVKAKLSGTAKSSPVLWPGTQLVSGEVAAAADYYSRSIPAAGATKAVLVYDAIIPSGASVKAELKKDNGAYAAMPAEGVTNQGDGLVEYRFKTALAGVNEIKVKFTLTGTSAARPVVRNIRLMAVI